MRPLVDIDDITTWPREVSDIVGQWAKQYEGTTEYTSDLALPFEAESTIRELLSGHLLRAYHCTRLLPHELQMVRSAGLRPLSAELISDRIDAALTAGEISLSDAEFLHEAHVFASGEHQYRENQVGLILSKLAFQEDPMGCKPLLSTWGGEGMYMSSKAAQIRERLKELGIPTVVVALLDLGGRDCPHKVFPALHKVFVGAVLGLKCAWADVFYRAAVPPNHIESILQAGDPSYDRLGMLPT
jgi:hypothetical protein